MHSVSDVQCTWPGVVTVVGVALRERTLPPSQLATVGHCPFSIALILCNRHISLGNLDVGLPSAHAKLLAIYRRIRSIISNVNYSIFRIKFQYIEHFITIEIHGCVCNVVCSVL